MQDGAVTSLYAALLGLLFVALSIRVIAARRASGQAIGFSGQSDLERRARVQANFAEYVPLALLLMLMAEGAGLGPLLIHALGALLIAGRVVHALGVSQHNEDFRLRVAGMVLTFTVIGTTACVLLTVHLSTWGRYF